MSINGTPFRFSFQTASHRDGGPGGWSDGVAGPTLQFDIQSTHVVVSAQSGTVVRLLTGETVTLAAGRLELYALDSNDKAESAGGLVTATDLGGDAAGLDVPLPMVAGRWLLNVYAHWLTDCLGGDGYADLLLVVE